MRTWLVHEVACQSLSVLNDVVADAVNGGQVATGQTQLLGDEHDAAVPKDQVAEVEWKDAVEVLAKHETLAQLPL